MKLEVAARLQEAMLAPPEHALGNAGSLRSLAEASNNVGIQVSNMVTLEILKRDVSQAWACQGEQQFMKALLDRRDSGVATEVFVHFLRVAFQDPEEQNVQNAKARLRCFDYEGAGVALDQPHADAVGALCRCAKALGDKTERQTDMLALSDNSCVIAPVLALPAANGLLQGATLD